MVVANSHDPNYLIFQNFILNCKILTRTCFRYIWKILVDFKVLLNIKETFHNFWELEYPYHSNGKNFSTLST